MKYIDGALWVRIWRQAGPRLEAIRRDEIRRTDHLRVVGAFGGAFREALRALPPGPTSGLVEQQRLFARRRDDRTD